MKVEYLAPTEKIAEFVEDIIVIKEYNITNPFVLPLFANGKPTLLFQTAKGKIKENFNYLTLFGQTVLPDQMTITGNFTLIAYFFKPFALPTLFGFGADELTDHPVGLNLVHYQTANELQEQLLNANSTDEMLRILDHYVFSLTTKLKSDIKLIQYATGLIIKNTSKEILSKVQRELCLTERTFQRMFEQKIGIPPNQYRRIVQFNAAFQQLNRQQFKNMADIAFTNNYADQSHFTRAFKEFTNLTPTEYLKFGKAD